MGQKTLGELAWLEIWGIKNGPRRVAWAGVGKGRKKKSALPGLLHGDIFSVEDLDACVAVTVWPNLGLNRYQ